MTSLRCANTTTSRRPPLHFAWTPSVTVWTVCSTSKTWRRTHHWLIRDYFISRPRTGRALPQPYTRSVSFSGWPPPFQASGRQLAYSARARRGGAPILGEAGEALLTTWLGSSPDSLRQNAPIVLVASLAGTMERLLERVRRWVEASDRTDPAHLQHHLDGMNRSALLEELTVRQVLWWRNRMLQFLEEEAMPLPGVDAPGQGAAGAGTGGTGAGPSPVPTPRGRPGVGYPRQYDAPQRPGSGQGGPASSRFRY